MAKTDLTAQQLRELLEYDHQTGVFTWLVKSPRVPIGGVAGCTNKNRSIIKLHGRSYFAHRLAWLYVTGDWPKHTIDHIDGNVRNNAFANLRDVTQAINTQNRRSAKSNNRCGLLGVTMRGTRFRANIMVNGKWHALGYFDTKDEAHAIYIEAKRRLHEGCTI